MKINLNYRIVLILFFSIVVILFPIIINGESITPIGDIIFIVIACSLILGTFFLVSYILSYKTRLHGISYIHNNTFLNMLLFLIISFFIFEFYFLKYKYSIFPKNGIYGDVRIVTDDKKFIIGSKIVELNNCSNDILENKIKGRINLVLESINVVYENNFKDTIYITEYIYLLNDDEKQLNYVELKIDNSCNLISFSHSCENKESRIKYLLERAKEDELKEVTNYEK